MIDRTRDPHRTSKWGLAIVSGALIAAAITGRASAASASATGTEWDRESTFDAINHASADTGVDYYRLFRIVACETGGKLDPYAEGDGGHSHGAAQLNDYGALNTFYAVGYTNPYDPYQAVYFLAESLRGDHPPLGPHTWSCKA